MSHTTTFLSFLHSDSNRRLHTDPSTFIDETTSIDIFHSLLIDYDPRTLYVPEDYLNSVTPVDLF